MIPISVIVPVYNVEKTLKRCVESILQQSFREYELLLINDGSTDNSLKICNEYAEMDVRIKVITQNNKGVSSARNNGIRHSSGKYVTFLDSDDYVDIDYLKIMHHALKRKKRELVICGVFFCREGMLENKIAQKDRGDFVLELKANNTEDIANLLRDKRFNYVYAKLYKREILNKFDIRFKEEISLGEDTIFVMDYLSHVNECVIIGKSYYNYIKYNKGTLTNRFYKDIYEKYTYINNIIESQFDKRGLLDNNIMKAIDERRMEAARWAISFIRNEPTVKKKEKKFLISNVLKNSQLQSSLNNARKCEKLNWEYKLMELKSGELLLKYYSFVEKKDCCVREFKILVVKIVPRKWIRKVKKWCGIVQS